MRQVEPWKSAFLWPEGWENTLVCVCSIEMGIDLCILKLSVGSKQMLKLADEVRAPFNGRVYGAPDTMMDNGVLRLVMS